MRAIILNLIAHTVIPLNYAIAKYLSSEITPVANILDNKFEVCDLIKDLSSGYEMLVGKNS